MKNKNLIIIVVVVLGVALAAAVGGYFLGKKDVLDGGVKNLPVGNGTNLLTLEQEIQGKLVTDDFTIDLPDGWRETPPSVGVSAMAVNVNEEVDEPEAQKINFKSYYAVSYDTFKGENISDYLQIAEEELKQAVPGVVFMNESQVAINGRDVAAVEANLTQQGADFKVLLVAVPGNDDDVWVITFNTTLSGWEKHKEIFADIVNSFEVRE